MPLDPFVQRVVHRAYRQGHAELPYKTVEEVRQHYQARRFSFDNYSPYYEDHKVEGAFIRIHLPSHKAISYPLLIYLRASGYVIGDIGDTDYFCHALSQYLNCVVAAVEPRCSPEYKFPLPFEDCLKSVEYLYQEQSYLKINFSKTAIWGESSGGNLAAALCGYLKKEKSDLIRRQVLFYPVLDRYHDYASKQLFGKHYLMDNTLTDWFFSHYLNHSDENQDVRVSPLLADSFEKLPPTFLIGAQYDPMRDEGIAYVNALLRSDVPIQTIIVPGMIHGFLWYAQKVKAARWAQLEAVLFLNQFFQNRGSRGL